MQQRLPSLLARPIAFAHRGARAHARENTLDAFALALRLGATGLESDVWLTADGIPVLDHDGVVRTGRTGRRRPLTSFRRDELPEHIPALTDLFERCGTDYHLSLDVQHPEAGPVVIAVVRESSPACGKVPKPTAGIARPSFAVRVGMLTRHTVERPQPPGCRDARENGCAVDHLFHRTDRR